MSEETVTTTEVAQALIDHTRLTNDGKCSCGFQGRLGESFTAHQAEALAEAGLLRDQAVIDERDMLKRGGAELGRQIDHYLTWVLDATGMHHLIDEDGDGDWELVWEQLAEMGRARAASETEATR
jgi:hypothetical protein